MCIVFTVVQDFVIKAMFTLLRRASSLIGLLNGIINYDNLVLYLNNPITNNQNI